MHMERIAAQIALWRKEKGLTQEQLAERINVSPQAVSKWENAKSVPDVESLLLLSGLFGCTIDALLKPQELMVLSAVLTDGKDSVDCTVSVSRFAERGELHFPVVEPHVPRLSGDRIKVLIVKYQLGESVHYAYAVKGGHSMLEISGEGLKPTHSGIEYEAMLYGNEKACNDVMAKIRHYQYFDWKSFEVNHELFPSPPGNDDADYLTIVYRSAQGLHCVSAQEGECIVLGDLLRVEDVQERYSIPGISSLAFGRGMDCSWAGALSAALEAMGEKAEYWEVMGVSGACWRVAFAPCWDYSSMDGLVAYDYATPGYAAFGYEVVWADRIDKAERAEERAAIVRDIRAHKPPIAINMRVAPEWGVIAGYLENGKTLLCRSYYDDAVFAEHKDDARFAEEMKRTGGYLHVDNWPFAIAHFGRRQAAPTRLENLKTSLKVKLESMNIEENRGYKMGYAALEKWREALLHEEWFEAAEEGEFARRMSVNHFCMMALADARESAAEYLASFGEELAEIAEMAEMYKAEAWKLRAFFETLACPDCAEEAPGGWRAAWTRECRAGQAALLTELAELERKADALAEIVISKM